jgi:hypothetical protein
VQNGVSEKIRVLNGVLDCLEPQVWDVDVRGASGTVITVY